MATSYGGGVKMSDHLNEISPAAVLLGREIVSVDTESGEVRLRFLADRQFSNRHGTVQGGMLAAMLDSATMMRTAASTMSTPSCTAEKYSASWCP
jgi:acyl-coenzyme A thioesterase PaaI-like protein